MANRAARARAAGSSRPEGATVRRAYRYGATALGFNSASSSRAPRTTRCSGRPARAGEGPRCPTRSARARADLGGVNTARLKTPQGRGSPGARGARFELGAYDALSRPKAHPSGELIPNRAGRGDESCHDEREHGRRQRHRNNCARRRARYFPANTATLSCTAARPERPRVCCSPGRRMSTARLTTDGECSPNLHRRATSDLPSRLHTRTAPAEKGEVTNNSSSPSSPHATQRLKNLDVNSTEPGRRKQKKTRNKQTVKGA